MGEGSFTVQVDAPQVTILSPDNNATIIRRSTRYVENIAIVDPTDETIQFRVEFPDNNPREIDSLTLSVDGAIEDSLNNIAPGADGVIQDNFTWDISQIDSGTFDLRIDLTDSLGFDVSSLTHTVRIELDMPDPPPAEEGDSDEGESDEPEEQEETNLINPPTDETGTVLDICALPDILNFLCPIENLLPYFNLAIIFVLAVLVIVLWFNRATVARVGQRATQAVTGFVERVTGVITRSRVRAILTIEAGDDDIGRELEIYGDSALGGSPQFADLVFQINKASSLVSGLHCRIIDKEDQFYIRDEDSTNGTLLNGKRLTPLMEMPLNDGDTIELAPVQRGGVRLKFKIVDDDNTGIGSFGDDITQQVNVEFDPDFDSVEMDSVDSEGITKYDPDFD